MLSLHNNEGVWILPWGSLVGQLRPILLALQAPRPFALFVFCDLPISSSLAAEPAVFTAPRPPSTERITSLKIAD